MRTSLAELQSSHAVLSMPAFRWRLARGHAIALESYPFCARILLAPYLLEAVPALEAPTTLRRVACLLVPEVVRKAAVHCRSSNVTSPRKRFVKLDFLQTPHGLEASFKATAVDLDRGPNPRTRHASALFASERYTLQFLRVWLPDPSNLVRVSLKPSSASS